MNRIAISSAAAALLRAIIARGAVPRDRILLTEMHSVDWQSLTFIGERHNFKLRIVGSDSKQIAERLCDGLEEAEFTIPGQIVADINIVGALVLANDGSTNITIEALTVEE
jgi:hypothetical protein